jgi:hypothetical protein
MAGEVDYGSNKTKCLKKREIVRKAEHTDFLGWTECDSKGTSLQRRVQKLASAPKLSFAEQDLLQDHNRLLHRINNEGEARHSTR